MLTEIRAYTRLRLPVVEAHGCEITLADGRTALDLYGGHCVNTLGAGDSGLADRLARQWQKLSFTTNLLDHASRREFLEALDATLPHGGSAGWQVFCTNSGAEANENALKIACAATKRRRVVYFQGAFHGRTAAAAAVSDTKIAQWPSSPFETQKLPWGNTAAAKAAINGDTAAVILEPIQSLAGVVEPPAGFLEGLREACNQSGACLIFDDVQTGNGRLGTPWSAQHYGVTPDLFTTAKGAAAGLPIGLTVARAEVSSRIPDGLLGSTFGGGPFVLSAAAEVARRVMEPGFLKNVREASAAFRSAALRGPVERVRGAGLLLGLVLRPGLKGSAVRDALLERGVLVGTSDDPRVLRLSPPLTIAPAAAQRLASALESVEAVA